MKRTREKFHVLPISTQRRFSLDAGRLGRGRHTIHGLIEVDVTDARHWLHQHEKKTDERLSFTGFIIKCIADAVSANKHVHAYKNWRNQLVIFEDVDVNTMIEIEIEGRKVPIPHILRAVDKRSFQEIHAEIRGTQASPARTSEAKFMRWFLYLPYPIRRIFYWFVMKFPQWFREYSSSILVTAVGMFGRGGGWGIPMPNFPLTITLGGIAEKPGVVNGRIEIREYLDITISFDHDVIDGAPAARFTKQLRDLIESGHGIENQHFPIPTSQAND
jgi:pyruvate/2-oxoglutarate dehydrogenase complex dihydrolipoamide acyltransferase (E2) component